MADGLNLTDRVSDYLPFLQDTDKKNITVRELLMHESGLPSTLLFYQEAIDEESYTGTLFKARPMPRHSARIGRQTWANPKFRFRQGLTSKVQTPEYTMQVSDSLWLNRSFKQEYLQKIVDTPLRDKRTVIVVWALSCCSSWSRRARGNVYGRIFGQGILYSDGIGAYGVSSSALLEEGRYCTFINRSFLA